MRDFNQYCLIHIYRQKEYTEKNHKKMLGENCSFSQKLRFFIISEKMTNVVNIFTWFFSLFQYKYTGVEDFSFSFFTKNVQIHRKFTNKSPFFFRIFGNILWNNFFQKVQNGRDFRKIAQKTYFVGIFWRFFKIIFFRKCSKLPQNSKKNSRYPPPHKMFWPVHKVFFFQIWRKYPIFSLFSQCSVLAPITMVFDQLVKYQHQIIYAYGIWINI